MLSCEQSVDSTSSLNNSKGNGHQIVKVKINVSSGGECANIVELFSAGLVCIHYTIPLDCRLLSS